jgi:thiosulfate dehydrogenase
MGKFWTGLSFFVLGLLVIPVVVYLYFLLGNPPVATSDKPFPFESQVVKVPLNARIKREAPATVPLSPTPEVLTAGATVYRDQCASCHGLQGHPSQFAKTMYPGAPQLWVKHTKSSVVGVSDDPAGETYWKIKNGIRLTGMPAYQSLLSDDQMWQVAVLLANADKPLPAAAIETLSRPFAE